MNNLMTIKKTRFSMVVTYRIVGNKVEIKFDQIPSEEIRAELKAHKFGYSKADRVWRGNADKHPENVALAKRLASEYPGNTSIAEESVCENSRITSAVKKSASKNSRNTRTTKKAASNITVDRNTVLFTSDNSAYDPRLDSFGGWNTGAPAQPNTTTRNIGPGTNFYMNIQGDAFADHIMIRNAVPPPVEQQDVNRNQEALFALLNETLGGAPIFKNRQLNERISRAARYDLDTFKLFGMVLWHKDRDESIETVVRCRYGTLQDNAGEKFKLMPLFSRSKKIVRNDDAEEYWDDLFRNVNRTITNDEYYTKVFLDALRVTNHSEPYLVLTKNFKSIRFLLVYLKGKELSPLVQKIGAIAVDCNAPLELYQQELHREGIQSEIRELDESFAESLIGPLAGIMKKSVTGMAAQSEAVDVRLKHAYEAYCRARDEIACALEKIDPLDYESIKYQEHLQEYEALCVHSLDLAVMNADQINGAQNSPFSEDMVRCLDEESLINVSTAIRAMALPELFNEDTAPITVALGKMFENEINLSIVQHIRRFLHIPMPDYYCKLFPEGNYMIGKTDFNRGKEQWLPPECGSTRQVVFYKNNNNNNPDIWNNMCIKYETLLQDRDSLTHNNVCENWLEIYRSRNDAAHPNENGHSQENLDKMKRALQNLDRSGFFPFMKGVRDHLSTNQA